MKVLLATSATQGTRRTDFNYCVDGELVWLSEPCYRDAHRLPNSCGCGEVAIRRFAATRPAFALLLGALGRDRRRTRGRSIRIKVGSGAHRGERFVELVDERDSRRDFELGDGVVADAVEIVLDTARR